MLQRRMFWKLRIVPNDGEEIARRTGDDEKISKKALEKISEAFFSYSCRFYAGGFEKCSLGIFFVKVNK